MLWILLLTAQLKHAHRGADIMYYNNLKFFCDQITTYSEGYQVPGKLYSASGKICRLIDYAS